MMTNRGKRHWIVPVLMSLLLVAGMVPLAFASGSISEGGPPVIEDSGQDVDTVFSGPAIVSTITLVKENDIQANATFIGRCGPSSISILIPELDLGMYRPFPDGTQVTFSNLTADDLTGYVFTLNNDHFNTCFPRDIGGFPSGRHYAIFNTVLNFDRSQDGTIITADVVVLFLLPR